GFHAAATGVGRPNRTCPTKPPTSPEPINPATAQPRDLMAVLPRDARFRVPLQGTRTGQGAAMLVASLGFRIRRKGSLQNGQSPRSLPAAGFARIPASTTSCSPSPDGID